MVNFQALPLEILYEALSVLGVISLKLVCSYSFVDEQFRIGSNLTLRRSNFETLNLSSQKWVDLTVFGSVTHSETGLGGSCCHPLDVEKVVITHWTCSRLLPHTGLGAGCCHTEVGGGCTSL